MSSKSRILVVDDEPYISRVIARTLSDDYDVSTADSAGEALDLLRANTAFDLILCDLMMPGMSGMDLHAAVAAEWPDVARRMMFLTGGAFTPRARTFLTGMPDRKIDKPFTSASLREVVGNLLHHAS